MYDKKTSQGWDIIAKYQAHMNTFVVVQRGENNYAWGSYYNEETGTWAQGHYDYTRAEVAEQDMLEFASGKKFIASDERSFNEELEHFAKTYATQQIGEDLDYTTFLNELHVFYADEIRAAYNKYKELCGEED